MSLNVLNEVLTVINSFRRSTGRPPARIKVGRAFLQEAADQCYPLCHDRTMTIDEYRAATLKSAQDGELYLYGMKVQFCESPTAGGQYGGAQQAGRANSLQSVPGASRRGVVGSSDSSPFLLGTRHDAEPGVSA